MFQVPSSQSYFQEQHSPNVAMAMPEHKSLNKSQMNLQSSNLYSQEMASFWEPQHSLKKSSNNSWFGESRSANMRNFFNSSSKVRSDKDRWLRKPEDVFQSVLPITTTDSKPGSWLDTFSSSMSTSSTKSISEESAEFRLKYPSWNNKNSGWKTQMPPDDSISCCNELCSYYHRPLVNSKQSKQQDHTIFEMIKAKCQANPWLMQKVVKWCNTHTKFSPITREDVLKLSQGRLWITVRSLKPSEDTDCGSLQARLDNIKGAYQEAEQGVYWQPKPEGKEEWTQHRFLKDSDGLRLIEKYDSQDDAWSVVAREHPDGQWFNCSLNLPIQVVIIPMQRILARMKDEGCLYQDIGKSVEFLFTSCDQNKLNTKLKKRTLKHNIGNLTNKIEKQYALSFAILIANTADKMTNDAES